MATPVYNQVALPQLGGSAQAAADAQVSSSLSNLGASLTGLESRLETRKQAKIDRDNAKAKNIFETALLNAKDENEFNDIVAEFSRAATADGFVLPDQAASIQASRTARLKDEESRQLGRGLGADADLTAASARLKIGEADAAANLTDMTKTYASRIAEQHRLDINRSPEAEAHRAALSADMAKSHGIDTAALWKTSEEMQTTGSATDTSLVEDATTRFASIDGRRATQALNTETVVGANSRTAGIIRSDREIADNEILNNVFAGLQRNNITLPGLLEAIDARTDLTDLQKNRISKLAKNVNFDETNPGPEFSDPTKTASYSQTPAQAAFTRLSNFVTGKNEPVSRDIRGINVDPTMASITDALDRANAANPSLAIYQRAQEFKKAGTYSKAWGNVGITLRNEQKGNYDIAPGETKILDEIKKDYSLTNEEVVAIAETAVQEDDGLLGLWNQPEIRNKRLKDAAAAYSSDRDNMAGTAATRYAELSQANANAAEFKVMQANAERAAQDNNPELARRYAARAAYLWDQIKGSDYLAENVESAATENPAAVAREIASRSRGAAVDPKTGQPFNRRAPQKP